MSCEVEVGLQAALGVRAASLGGVFLVQSADRPLVVAHLEMRCPLILLEEVLSLLLLSCIRWVSVTKLRATVQSFYVFELILCRF